MFKVQVPRADPVEVPSLVSIYPGAEFQEREAWDLLGIKFTGHPDLRRILMWEGFAGLPLRKDWHEPYFEEEAKPFKSRWPDGKIVMLKARIHTVIISLIRAISIPETRPSIPRKPFTKPCAHTRRTRSAWIPIISSSTSVRNTPPPMGSSGWQSCWMGKRSSNLKPVMGYLHRNHEKIGERNTYIMNMPYTDRLDYLASMSNNFGYALAVEKLMNVKPTERAEYIRVIMAEMTRISNHLFLIGSLLNDLGAYFTPMLYALKSAN